LQAKNGQRVFVQGSSECEERVAKGAQYCEEMIVHAAGAGIEAFERGVMKVCPHLEAYSLGVLLC
jgi:hypothetical protein